MKKNIQIQAFLLIVGCLLGSCTMSDSHQQSNFGTTEQQQKQKELETEIQAINDSIDQECQIVLNETDFRTELKICAQLGDNNQSEENNMLQVFLKELVDDFFRKDDGELDKLELAELIRKFGDSINGLSTSMNFGVSQGQAYVNIPIPQGTGLVKLSEATFRLRLLQFVEKVFNLKLLIKDKEKELDDLKKSLY